LLKLEFFEAGAIFFLSFLSVQLLNQTDSTFVFKLRPNGAHFKMFCNIFLFILLKVIWAERDKKNVAIKRVHFLKKRIVDSNIQIIILSTKGGILVQTLSFFLYYYIILKYNN
jgi:hypothetical protein